MGNEKPTKEEIEKQKKEQRDAALKTFKGNLINLAAAFYVENSNQYGEAGASAVDEFIYNPAIRSKEGSDLLYGKLFESRQGGKRYTGNVSEYYIIATAAKIVGESLGRITVDDIYGLMGSKVKIDEQYKGKYIEELDKETNKTLAGAYIADLMDKKVAEALTKRAQARVSKLEEMVKEKPKEK